MSEYPEADKWREVAAERAAITEFLESLTGQGIELCVHQERGVNGWNGPAGYHPILDITDRLLYRYFGIDDKALEAERRDMLSKLAESNG